MANSTVSVLPLPNLLEIDCVPQNASNVDVLADFDLLNLPSINLHTGQNQHRGRNLVSSWRD